MDQEARRIRRIQRFGSKRDADLLIQAYYREIYVYAYRQTGSKETAMDLAQEIFIAVLQSIGRYDSGRASFRTWLYRIATNKIIDFQRQTVPAMIPLEDCPAEEEPSGPDFADDVHRRDLICRVEAFVSAMPEDVQQVYRLRVYGEQSFPEIAALLGQSEAAVKARYYRLTKRLRKEFSDEI